MNVLLRRLMARLMDEANAGEGGGSGGGADAGQSDGGQQGDQGAGQGQGAAGGEGEGQGSEGQGAGDNKDGQQQGDQKGEDGKEAKAAAKAPEKYEIKTPEGFTVDSELMGEFEGIAKGLDLDNEGAQKLADLAPKFAEKVIARQAEAWAETTAQWAKDVQADKDLGGDKLAATEASCQKAMSAFGTPALKEFLEATKLGDHPEMVRAFAKIGQAISDDGMVRSGQGGGKRDPADVLFDGK